MFVVRMCPLFVFCFSLLWRLQPKVVTIFQKIGQSKEVYDALKFLQVPACQRCVVVFLSAVACF